MRRRLLRAGVVAAVVAAVAAGAIALVASRRSQVPGEGAPDPGGGTGRRSDTPWPPPWPAGLAARVDAAHRADAARAVGLAPDLVAHVGTLERAEDAGDEATARTQAAELAGLASRTARDLGADAWRAVTSALAVGAVDALRAGAGAGAPSGAFFKRVLEPTGVLDAQGRGHPPDGWHALAQVLHRVRLLRAGQPPGEAPERAALSDDERNLYWRWKVERAVKSKRTVRLDALRRLRLLDPGYPSAEAEARIIRRE